MRAPELLAASKTCGGTCITPHHYIHITSRYFKVSVQMHGVNNEEDHTQQHLDEQVAVSIPGVLVPAVGQVVSHIHDDAWIPILSAHQPACQQPTVRRQGSRGGGGCIIAGACVPRSRHPSTQFTQPLQVHNCISVCRPFRGVHVVTQDVMVMSVIQGNASDQSSLAVTGRCHRHCHGHVMACASAVQHRMSDIVQTANSYTCQVAENLMLYSVTAPCTGAAEKEKAMLLSVRENP